MSAVTVTNNVAISNNESVRLRQCFSTGVPRNPGVPWEAYKGSAKVKCFNICYHISIFKRHLHKTYGTESKLSLFITNNNYNYEKKHHLNDIILK